MVSLMKVLRELCPHCGYHLNWFVDHARDNCYGCAVYACVRCGYVSEVVHNPDRVTDGLKWVLDI